MVSLVSTIVHINATRNTIYWKHVCVWCWWWITMYHSISRRCMFYLNCSPLPVFILPTISSTRVTCIFLYTVPMCNSTIRCVFFVSFQMFSVNVSKFRADRMIQCLKEIVRHQKLQVWFFLKYQNSLLIFKLGVY